jgi:hypothetical protein
MALLTTILLHLLSLASAIAIPAPITTTPLATRVTAPNGKRCDIVYCSEGEQYCHYWEPPSGQYDPLTGEWEKGGEVRAHIGPCPTEEVESHPPAYGRR